MKFRLFASPWPSAPLLAPGRQGSAQEQFPYQIFDRYLGPLVQQIGMPGLSAVIIQGATAPGRIAWKGEYGYADLERKIPATIDTPYPVGGITQALTGVLIGVCIDRYGFNIDQTSGHLPRRSPCGKPACARSCRMRPMDAFTTTPRSIRR